MLLDRRYSNSLLQWLLYISTVQLVLDLDDLKGKACSTG